MVNLIIVDDEQSSLDLICELLKDYPSISLLGSFQNSLIAKKFIENNKVDVVLADIEMPGMNGFELVPTMLERGCSYIFITGHDQYAVEAFEHTALDYLLKPIGRERFRKAMERVLAKYEDKISENQITTQCFGSFKILAGKNEIKFRTSKAKELIAYLIHSGGKSVNRAEIIDKLWGDFDGDKAIANFNTTLSYAKKSFSSYGIEFPLFFDKGCYIVDMSKIECDYTFYMISEFSSSLINESNIEYYEYVASLYIGDYLLANDYTWAEYRRLQIKARFLKLSLAISKYYSDNNDFDKAIEYTINCFSAAPLDTEVASSLIKTLLNAGNFTLALSFYKIHKDSLESELHIEPDKNLKRIMGF